MLFRFKIGWGNGRVRIRHVPIIAMLFWRVSHAEEARVEFRPSARTVLDQLCISMVAAVVLAALLWFAGWPWPSARNDRAGERSTRVELQEAAEFQAAEEELKRLMPPEKVAELEQGRAKRLAEMEESRDRLHFQRSIFSGLMHGFHWLAFAVLGGIAVVPWIGLPFQKLVIERTKGELILRKRGLLPSTRRWPASAFGEIAYGVEEERRRISYRRYALAWRWMVTLRGNVQRRRGAVAEVVEVSFYVARQRQTPEAADGPPAYVRDLVAALGRLTGASVVTQPGDELALRRRTYGLAW